MDNLVNELLLRLVKPLIGLVLGAILYWLATGVFGAGGGVELALLSWLSAAAFILLVQEGII